MKIYGILLCLINVLCLPSQAEFNGKTLTFEEALKNKHLQFQIKGLEDSEITSSRHYGKSLKISIRNNDDKPYMISIPIGAIFSARDSNTQDMVATKPQLIEVSSKNITSSYLYAMCIEMTGSSPKEKDLFKYTKMAKSQLLSGCRYIEKMNYQNEIGQDILWAITDGLDIYDLSGSEEIVRMGQNFLSELLDFKIDPIKQASRFGTKSCGSRIGSQTYELLFQIYLEKRAQLSLLLYNSKGEIERTLYDGQDQAKGRWDISYTLTGNNLGNRKFKAVLLVDGEEHSYYSFEFGKNYSATDLTRECTNPKIY